MKGVEDNFFLFEGTGQLVHTLYRGQQMSTSELNQLKACVGGTTAMTSFLSATKNLDVAEMFAGNGEETCDIESVIFEIIIDESEYDYERSPFAYISQLSSKNDESEVLLSLGTTLRVEFVETKQQVTWVRVRMRQREVNEVPRQLFVGWENAVSVNSNVGEILSLGQLSTILSLMGNFRQSKQLLKWMQSLTDPAMDSVAAFWFESVSLITEHQELDRTDADHNHRWQTVVGTLKKATRSLLNSRSLDDREHDPMISAISLLDHVFHMSKSDQESMDISELTSAFMNRMGSYYQMNVQPVWNLVKKRELLCLAGTGNFTDQSHEVKIHDILDAYRDKKISENDPKRIELCWDLANDAYKKRDYDQAIKLFREGLAIPSNKAYHAMFYRKLYRIYHKQENWLAVIECCQGIINMPQLTPNSSFIVESYLKCGSACIELEDYSEALINYTKALELQEQHHPPRHPRTAKIHVELGSLFSTADDTDTAMKHFEIAIALDFPESTFRARLRTSMICISMKKYGEARFHLLHCLDIGQRDSFSSVTLNVYPYVFLAEIEHITGNHQQRDLYFQQGLCLASSSDEQRDFFSKITRTILSIPFPSTS